MWTIEIKYSYIHVEYSIQVLGAFQLLQQCTGVAKDYSYCTWESWCGSDTLHLCIIIKSITATNSLWCTWRSRCKGLSNADKSPLSANHMTSSQWDPSEKITWLKFNSSHMYMHTFILGLIQQLSCQQWQLSQFTKSLRLLGWWSLVCSFSTWLCQRTHHQSSGTPGRTTKCGENLCTACGLPFAVRKLNYTSHSYFVISSFPAIRRWMPWKRPYSVMNT